MRRQKMSAIFKRTWYGALGGDKVQFVKFNALVHRNWNIGGTRFSTAKVMLATKLKPWWHFLNMSLKSRKFVTEIILALTSEVNLLPDHKCWILLNFSEIGSLEKVKIKSKLTICSIEIMFQSWTRNSLIFSWVLNWFWLVSAIIQSEIKLKLALYQRCKLWNIYIEIPIRYQEWSQSNHRFDQPRFSFGSEVRNYNAIITPSLRHHYVIILKRHKSTYSVNDQTSFVTQGHSTFF